MFSLFDRSEGDRDLPLVLRALEDNRRSIRIYNSSNCLPVISSAGVSANPNHQHQELQTATINSQPEDSRDHSKGEGSVSPRFELTLKSSPHHTPKMKAMGMQLLSLDLNQTMKAGQTDNYRKKIMPARFKSANRLSQLRPVYEIPGVTFRTKPKGSNTSTAAIKVGIQDGQNSDSLTTAQSLA